MQYESVEKAAAIAEQSLPVLKQLEQIDAKAKTPGKPLQDQLDPQHTRRNSDSVFRRL